jgi:hypothetical protein
MMMAHDSRPGPRGLAQETIDEMRAALEQYIASPGANAALRISLHRMAAEARERAILPEQLLVILKDIWYSVPMVRDMDSSEDQVHLLQRVVTMCIREYYSGS